jgi:hypothetical protein
MDRHPSRPLAILTIMLLTACTAETSSSGSPADVPTTAAPTDPTESPAASASASASATADPSPSEAASGPITADAIVVARVDGLRVRGTPGLDGESLGTLATGYESIVVDGPELVDGLEWYLVSGLGLPFGSGCATGPGWTTPYTCPVWLGWAARAGDDGSPWLEETEPECADPNGSLDDFAFQPRYLYIACYGDQPLTLRGNHQVVGGIADCPGVPQDLYWLGCVGGQNQLVSAPDAGIGLVLTVAPGGSLPGGEGALEVTGHFDDPESARCTYGDEPELSVLTCRSQFVVDSGVTP